MAQGTLTGRFVKGTEVCRMENQVAYKAIDRSQGCNVAWIEWELMCFKPDKRAKKAKQLITRLELWSKIKSEYLLALVNEGDGSFIINNEGTAVVAIAELMCTTLKGFLDKAGGVSVATIQNWGGQIARGLNFIHTASPRMIHRNLKLESIFYDAKEARLKIGDLSTAKLINPSKPLPKRKKGARNRRAPDFYAQPPGYDCKVDIWTFGLCLIEMATLLAPYHEFGTDLDKVEKAIITGVKPRSLRMIDSPDSLTHLISSCLATNPKERPDAATLLEFDFLKKKIPQRDLFVQFKAEFRQEIAKTLTTTTNRSSGGYPLLNQLIGQLPGGSTSGSSPSSQQEIPNPARPRSTSGPPASVELSRAGTNTPTVSANQPVIQPITTANQTASSSHASPQLSPRVITQQGLNRIIPSTPSVSSGSSSTTHQSYGQTRASGPNIPLGRSISSPNSLNRQVIKPSQNTLRRSGLQRVQEIEDVILNESEIMPPTIIETPTPTPTKQPQNPLLNSSNPKNAPFASLTHSTPTNSAPKNSRGTAPAKGHRRKASDEDVLIKLPIGVTIKKRHERRKSQDEVLVFPSSPYDSTSKETPKRSPPNTTKGLSFTFDPQRKSVEDGKSALQESKGHENANGGSERKPSKIGPLTQSNPQPEPVEDDEIKDKGWLKKFDTQLRNFVASSHHT